MKRITAADLCLNDLVWLPGGTEPAPIFQLTAGPGRTMTVDFMAENLEPEMYGFDEQLSVVDRSCMAYRIAKLGFEPTIEHCEDGSIELCYNIRHDIAEICRVTGFKPEDFHTSPEPWNCHTLHIRQAYNV